MSSVVFVVSEQGYWGEECVRPLQAMGEEGFEVTVATPTGNPPKIDERSVDPQAVGERLAEEIRTCHRTDERLNDPVPLVDVEPADHAAAVFPGGHGTVWDVNQDRHARRILSHMLETRDKKALVVCHAVGILAFTRGEDGEHLVDGRRVTGFPNAWEEGIVDDHDRLPDGRKLPYWVEDEVVAAGGIWDAELDRETSVAVDDALVTARGPASSERGVRTLLDELASP